MNIEVIQTKYPKAFEKMKVWAQKKIVGSLGLPTELANAIPNEALLPSLVNSRSLYDFFDEYSIFILIDKRGKNWSTNIIGQMESSRIGLENTAFEAAFGILEHKLTNE